MKRVIIAIVFFGNAYLNPASWAEETLAQLTLREKIAQLFVVTVGNETEFVQFGLKRFPPTDPAYVISMIHDYRVGGVLFLQKDTCAHQLQLMQEYQRLSKVPLLVLEDNEWGANTRLTDVLNLPRNSTLGAIRDDELLYAFGKEVGRQCVLLGVHINLAPVADVNNNPANPVIGRRSFGADPERVAHAVELVIRGMQDAGVLACVKHFPGHGDTSIDSHAVLPVIAHARARLDTVELVPFKRAITAGVAAVMPGHLMVLALDTNLPATISPVITTQLLRNELGFTGLVITDALFMGAVDQVADLELRAFLAGNDLLLGVLDIPRAIMIFEEAARDGRLSQEMLDARVLAILRAKERTMFTCPHLVGDIATLINTPEAYALKKRLYQEAITLVHGRESCLIHMVAHIEQDQAARMSRLTLDTSGMGEAWASLSWPLASSGVPEGRSRDERRPVEAIQIGTAPGSIFSFELVKAGIPVHQVSAQVDAHEMHDTLAQCTAHTIVVGLFDIQKSARYKNFGIADTTLQLLRELQNRNKQVVLLIFGTPYCLGLFDTVDTVLMAYEDDPDAQEAAIDVLLGKREAHGT